jgi:hypothetical protein
VFEIDALEERTRPIAERLLELEQPALRRLTGRRPDPVQTYRGLLDELAVVDLTGPGGAAFRTRFNGYYGVRRNEAWRDGFYRSFEWAKRSGLSPAGLFATLLERLHAETARVEASFISKLVATLHPEQPVIDSIVTAFLRPHLQVLPINKDLQRAVQLYKAQFEFMDALTPTPEAQRWFALFDVSIASDVSTGAISPMKKLDFLIWAGAARSQAGLESCMSEVPTAEA